MPKIITDDLSAFLKIIPRHIYEPLSVESDLSELVEIVLDLGRPAEARFPKREVILDSREVTQEDLDYVISKIGSFSGDNRAGIERTLHRISAIRNRKGKTVGLTCRVGRAIFGTVNIIYDLVQSGQNILLLGRPGVGKTTMLREAARVLADDIKKRVIIVDTSNEIAGDGDIPHPAIGHARRMQVPTPNMQHAVMIEAVENHMPEVIVIDEIGTELEAQAARTIAERGVQLIGTAHGNTIDNLIMNPTLSDLIGGVEAVTLGDEEAKRRGTQKTILERRAPPTFDIVVEIRDRNQVAVHRDTAQAVDALLRGQELVPEIRRLNEDGEIVVEHQPPASAQPSELERTKRETKNTPRLYLFGVNKGRLEQVASQMQLNLSLANNLSEADLLVTPKRYFRRKPRKIQDAETSHLPIYVLRSQTPFHLRQLLSTLQPASNKAEGATSMDMETGINEAQEAIDDIHAGRDSVELSPQGAYIRRLQHLIAERNKLNSKSIGVDPERRVVIYKDGPEG